MVVNGSSSDDDSGGAAFFRVLPTEVTALLLSVCTAFSLAAAMFLYRKRRELNTAQAIV